uniref:Uncharacterized protein n=1 Tax=Oryza punctata TaxID=4537 RepID=A0A0E0KH17_ORYPU
ARPPLSSTRGCAPAVAASTPGAAAAPVARGCAPAAAASTELPPPEPRTPPLPTPTSSPAAAAGAEVVPFLHRRRALHRYPRQLLLRPPSEPEPRSSPSAAAVHSTAAHAGDEVVPSHRRSRVLPHPPSPLPPEPTSYPVTAGAEVFPIRLLRRSPPLPHVIVKRSRGLELQIQLGLTLGYDHFLQDICTQPEGKRSKEHCPNINDFCLTFT